jgi:two-component system sensor histidine kinase AlgZ
MDIQLLNKFVFSLKYTVWRHTLFWVSVGLFSLLVWIDHIGLWKGLIIEVLWLPARILFCYPIIYWVVPKLLLKERYVQFILIIALWIIAGWFFNYAYRAYVFIPLEDALHFKNINREPWQQGSYLFMTTVAGYACMIVLFKHWMKKQQEWMQAEKEKVTVELQLLKAQVHPHFLFNTLNNIYSFSLQHSVKTPGLILKLSSLLGYMLYDCKADLVLLEKEIEVMKDYVDLETERYGNRIDISWSVEGDIKNKYIVPLLLLPFVENAFKHGTSEQLEKPWLSFDLVVKQNTIKYKVANSKNEFVTISKQGIGMENVKKRLSLLYPNKHELKINDEGNFFVVALLLELANNHPGQSASPIASKLVEENTAI